MLDEADEMLDRGFAKDVEAIIGRTSSQRQTALFSATMPEWVTQTSGKHLRRPVRVEVDAGLQAPPSVEHSVYSIEQSDKFEALQNAVESAGRHFDSRFSEDQAQRQETGKAAGLVGIPRWSAPRQSKQGARERVLAAFRSGEVPILVATNVAARGLDVEGIGQVINFDLPDSGSLFTITESDGLGEWIDPEKQ